MFWGGIGGGILGIIFIGFSIFMEASTVPPPSIIIVILAAAGAAIGGAIQKR